MVTAAQINSNRAEQRPPQRTEQRLKRAPKSDNRFHVPPEEIPDGMSYQWNTVSVMGNEEIAREQKIHMERNHWTPVPAKRHPWLSGSKTSDGPIIIGGQMLCERPSYLTDEARAEDLRNATTQYGHQFKRLTEAPDGTGPRDNKGRSLVSASRSFEPVQAVPDDDE